MSVHILHVFTIFLLIESLYKKNKKYTKRSRSVSCAGDVRENGRVSENKNGECESPVWIDLTTPWSDIER